jgi:hypothetical protein
MSIEANYVLGAIAVGIGATLVMDLWNLEPLAISGNRRIRRLWRVRPAGSLRPVQR